MRWPGPLCLGYRVDEEVGATRDAVLDLLGLSGRTHAVSFTLNTTYGINLLLGQLPAGAFQRVVTSHIEHNSVFLPTMTAARRLGVGRLVLERGADGGLVYTPGQLDGAVVVVNAVSNVDGTRLANLAELVGDVHARGGIVVLDAAQAVPHAVDLLRGTDADALCFSGHKAYAPTLGVVVARRELLDRLELGFVGGGMVSDVREDGFDLVSDDPASRLEPGLQAWARIVGLGAALRWLSILRVGDRSPSEHLDALAEQLYAGLAEVPGITLLTQRPGPTRLPVRAKPGRASPRRVPVTPADHGVRSGTSARTTTCESASRCRAAAVLARAAFHGRGRRNGGAGVRPTHARPRLRLIAMFCIRPRSSCLLPVLGLFLPARFFAPWGVPGLHCENG